MAKSNVSSADASLSTAQADALREKVRSVVGNNKNESIDLCQMVWETDVNMVRLEGKLVYCWEVWGYKTWEDFLGKEMDLHLKTAQGLKRVWETFYVDLASAWDKSLLLGITKMRLLTLVRLDKNNVEKWLRRAAGMNCRKLRATIMGVEDYRSFKVDLTSSQFDAMTRALDLARTSFTSGEKMSRGELLIQVVKGWRDANKGAGLRRVA